VIETRRLAPDERREAFPIVSQLRDLDVDEFLRRVALAQDVGYELIGAFADARLVGVMGIRPMHTLMRGFFLQIDDIVVDRAVRGSGAGAALIAFAERDGRERGMTSIHLTARAEAVPFYERLGFAVRAPAMFKSLT
jgi:GNAT superfamily N-acetyltransferase